MTADYRRAIIFGVGATALIAGSTAEAAESPGKSPIVPDALGYLAQTFATTSSSGQAVLRGYSIPQPDGTAIIHHLPSPYIPAITTSFQVYSSK